jgi:hypothetical protein
MKKTPSGPPKEFNRSAIEIVRLFTEERRQTSSLANYLAAIGRDRMSGEQPDAARSLNKRKGTKR